MYTHVCMYVCMYVCIYICMCRFILAALISICIGLDLMLSHMIYVAMVNIKKSIIFLG